MEFIPITNFLCYQWIRKSEKILLTTDFDIDVQLYMKLIYGTDML